MKNKSTPYFIFDLDDTLFYEIDFLQSGYRYILKSYPIENKRIHLFQEMMEKYHSHENVFEWLAYIFSELEIDITKEDFIKQYREHLPDIKLREDAQEFLSELKNRDIPFGLITDGRSLTQRNKLKALRIESWFKDIIISEEFGSEKPDSRNYMFFYEKYPQSNFYFIGDNTKKDFIVPKQLGWTIYCLKDKGFNIHKQDLKNLSSTEIIQSFKEIQF